MGIPYGALLPLFIVGASLAAASVVIKKTQQLANNGKVPPNLCMSKPKRHSLDKWDKMMIERDTRITGRASAQYVPSRA